MAYQSLYRRYRPQRFGEVRGQEHVTRTLTNAVREGRVSHAYLFSGPRGTGKTSTARILAKALNCPDMTDGEPCGVCESCVAITEGRSLDVVEMDAASNRGIDAMRDLIGRVSLATPGRWKVYIVDEVHMLTTEAANALLKTLESPPPHVVFVLATTEPQKVLPTVQSRTQPFEFRLLPARVLVDHLRWVADDAGLEVAPEAIELVARRGSGSARDALSALDQVAAAGGIEHEGPGADDLVEALCEHDVAAALVTVAERCGTGHDPRQLTRELLEQLRHAFLATIDRNLVGLPDEDLDRVEGQGRRLGRPAAVRAMEVLGQSLVDMREAPDPRVLLEVALVRLCRPELDTTPESLVERLERLERAVAGGHRATPAEPGPPTPAPAAPAAAPVAPAAAAAAPSPTAAARKALGGVRPARPAQPAPNPAPTPPPRARPQPAPAPAPAAGADRPFPSREELTLAWGDTVIGRLPQRARARFRAGRFAGVEGDTALFALPDQFHRDRCQEVVADVEEALSAHFGRRVRLRLVVDGAEAPRPPAPAGPPPPEPPPEEESVAWDELTDAPAGAVASPLEHVLQVFEGAEVVEEPDGR
ncbi:MAG: DNA polymerase III subunit gamma/tau [Acidimicrobiia bacterium]